MGLTGAIGIPMFPARDKRRRLWSPTCPPFPRAAAGAPASHSPCLKPHGRCAARCRAREEFYRRRRPCHPRQLMRHLLQHLRCCRPRLRTRRPRCEASLCSRAIRRARTAQYEATGPRAGCREATRSSRDTSSRRRRCTTSNRRVRHVRVRNRCRLRRHTARPDSVSTSPRSDDRWIGLMKLEAARARRRRAAAALARARPRATHGCTARRSRGHRAHSL